MSIFEKFAYRCWYGPIRRPIRAAVRRLAGDDPRILLGPLKGLRFNGQETVCRAGLYELHVQYAIRELLNAGDVFFDIGANNGYLSLLGARCVGQSGMVYSFEPLPANAQRIKTLMAENRIGSYELITMAVSKMTGTTEFYVGDDSDPYTPSLIRERRNQMLNVRMTTLDDFIKRHRSPDFIKMDIEGAEVLALEGASTLLSGADAPRWLIEIHSPETDQGCRAILSGHGYKLSVLKSPASEKEFPFHLVALK